MVEEAEEKRVKSGGVEKNKQLLDSSKNQDREKEQEVNH